MGGVTIIISCRIPVFCASRRDRLLTVSKTAVDSLFPWLAIWWLAGPHGAVGGVPIIIISKLVAAGVTIIIVIGGCNRVSQAGATARLLLGGAPTYPRAIPKLSCVLHMPWGSGEKHAGRPVAVLRRPKTGFEPRARSPESAGEHAVGAANGRPASRPRPRWRGRRAAVTAWRRAPPRAPRRAP